MKKSGAAAPSYQSFLVRVNELNRVVRVRNAMVSRDLMEVVFVQRVGENIDDTHQSLDDDGAAE